MYLILALICTLPVLAYYTWKIFNLAWFKPKKLEQFLRHQGFNGTSYKFLLGDFKEMSSMSKEAKSKPIDFSTDFVPRILPFIHDTITIYGIVFVYSMSPKI